MAEKHEDLLLVIGKCIETSSDAPISQWPSTTTLQQIFPSYIDFLHFLSLLKTNTTLSVSLTEWVRYYSQNKRLEPLIEQLIGVEK